MLTLSRDPKKKDTKLIDVFAKSQKRRRTPINTVYFTHDQSEDRQNQAPATGVLALHRTMLKKANKISGANLDEICRMIDEDEEPDQGDPLRPAYWNVLEVYERALKREMYLGDQDDTFFRLDLPTNKTDWPGTFTLIGNSGAGKTYFLVEMIIRYLKAVHRHRTRPILWFSPEWEIDKTLAPLKHPRYSLYVIGTDIGHQAVKKSGMDAASYFQTKVHHVLEKHGEGAIVVFDDFRDAHSAMVPMLRKAYNTMLRTARHRNSSVIQLAHTYAGGKLTSQALQSNKYVIFFPRSQRNRCIRFLTDHLMMSVQDAKEMVQRFASLDRSMIIQMHSPVAIMCSKYITLV